jgi:nucleoside-diphosphate-sugar epimerase
MKVFVTGGLGQIGSHIIEMLLERGDQVVAIDNLATGRREHLTEHPNLKVVIDTIADKQLVDQLVGDFKPDAIVHTAASYKDPDDWYNDTLTNCVGGSNIVDAAKKFIEKDPAQPRYLQTVWGFGYVFVPDGTSRET